MFRLRYLISIAVILTSPLLCQADYNYDGWRDYGSGSADTDFVITVSAPTLTSIAIVGGATHTNDSTPAISITPGGNPTHVALSCNGGTNWSDWISYPADNEFNTGSDVDFNIATGATACSATNGSKTITVKIKNSTGESSTRNDSITYDTTDPVITNVVIASTKSDYFYETDTDLTGFNDRIFFNSLTSQGSAQTITLTLTSTETNPDAASGETAFSDSPTDADDEGTQTLVYTIETDAVTFHDLTSTVTDKAGNSATYDVDFVQDHIAPTTAVTIANNIYSTDFSHASTINGTASDSGSGVASTQITIKREDGETDHYWDGSDWDATTATWIAVTAGTTTWTYTIDDANLTNAKVYEITARSSDNAGNTTSSSYGTDSFTYDTTSPTIINVSSDKADGFYKAGEVIDIDLTFSEAVTSTGDVTVTLETGDTDRFCTFTLSSATTGTCNYTVQAGDISTDLTVKTIAGTIKNASQTPIISFTPTTNLAANKAIFIDTIAPTTAVTIANNIYSTEFSHASTINGTASDSGSGLASTQITIKREDGDTDHYWDGSDWDATTATWIAVTAGTTTWTYTIDDSNFTNAKVYEITARASDSAGNTTSSGYSTDSFTYDVIPTITNVSSDKADGFYKAGEVIDIDLTFSEAVTSTGDVTVTLETGDTDYSCTFTVSSAATGSCNYTVQAGDISTDLTVKTIAGTIKDANQNAITNFTPATDLAANKAIVIDTTIPTTAVTIADVIYGTDFSHASTINGTASDSGSGVASTQITIKREDGETDHYWDGSDWDATTATWIAVTAGTTTWTYTIDDANLTNAKVYEITARASDNAGNTTSSSYGTDSFTYDAATEAPTLTTPAASSANNSSVAIDFTLPEIVSTTTVKMTFTRASGTADSYSPHVITFKPTFETAAQHSTSLNGADLSDNTTNVLGVTNNGNADSNDALIHGAVYNVKIEYQDAVGNAVASTTNNTFTYDTTVPTVQASTLTSPNGAEIWTGGGSATYNITWTAAHFTDATAGLAANPITLDYSVDEGSSWIQIATDEANDSSYTWTTPDLTDAEVRIRVTATDNAGNTASDTSDANLRLSAHDNWVALHVDAGNNQVGGMDVSLTNDLKVRVGNGADSGEIFPGADGVTVTFTLYAVPETPTAVGQVLANGSFGTTFGGTSVVKTASTNASGYASVDLTLGDRAGAYTVIANFTNCETSTAERTFTSTEREVFKFTIASPTLSVDVNPITNVSGSASTVLSITTNAASYQINIDPNAWPTYVQETISNWSDSLGFGWDNNGAGTSGGTSVATAFDGLDTPTDAYICSGGTCQGTKEFTLDFHTAVNFSYDAGTYQNTLTVYGVNISF